MIQIEDIEEIPRLMWNETSGKEFGKMPYESHKALVELSDVVKLLRSNGKPLIVAGLFRRSFLSVPYLWTLITEEFRNAPPSMIRAVVRVVDRFAPMCETLVERDNVKAERLAKAFGFRATDGVTVVGDTYYRLYRRG